MITLFPDALAPARTQYRTGLVFKHKNGACFQRDFCNGAKLESDLESLASHIE